MKKRKNKPIVFTQECGIYTDQILVCVGASKQLVFNYFKKNKVSADFSKWVLGSDFFNDIQAKHKGLFAWNTDIEGCCIFLRPFENTWDYWETLMHEVHHVVEHLAKKKMFSDEVENKAYLHEFLFRSIRRKLQKQ